MNIAILWPTFALVALIFLVWFKLFVDRLGHIRRNPPSKADFATGTAATRYFEPVELPAANFRNLFERNFFRQVIFNEFQHRDQPRLDRSARVP